MSGKERFHELVKERDFIESSLLNSMKELEELGIGPKDSLLDSEGYPRGDIDLYRVRALKSSIARQQNDFKHVMQKIENLLPNVIPANNNFNKEENTNFSLSTTNNLSSSLKPFARVGIVPTGSVAFSKGLCSDDLIIQFGRLTCENFKSDLLDFKNEIDRLKSSDSGEGNLTVMFIRNSETKTIEIDLKQQPLFSLGCQMLLL